MSDPYESESVLKCAVCAQRAHGLHFGVMSCRPCAAFFRRCIVEKRTYHCLRGTNSCNIQLKGMRNGCKACRMQICRLVGMIYDARSNSDDVHSCEGRSADQPQSHLAKLVAAYRKLIDGQRSFLRALHHGNTAQRTTITVPTLEEHFCMEQSTKTMFFTMLDKAIKPFSEMDHQSKMNLLEKNFARLLLLFRCQLSIEFFPGPNDTRCMSTIGHMFEVGAEPFQKIMAKWEIEDQKFDISSNVDSIRCSLEQLYAIVKIAKQIPGKITQRDICALMVICLWNSATKTLKNVEVWNQYKEEILTNWHQTMMSSTSADGNGAGIQMARIISMLTHLDTPFADECAQNRICLSRSTSSSSSSSIVSSSEFNDEEEIENNEHCWEQHQIVSKVFGKDNRDSNEIAYIARLIKAHHRIWGAFNDLPDQYMMNNKFINFGDLFSSTENLLGQFEQFSIDPKPMNENERSTLFEELEQLGTIHKHPRIQKAIVVYRLIAVGIAKAMPFFRRLALEDQVILARALAQPINFFLNGFYAASIRCNTWKGKDGLTSMDIYRAIPRFRDDPRLMVWAQKSLTFSVEQFLRYPIEWNEEFALLLGVLFSHSAIPEMSLHAKELLYEEQLRYSGLLLRRLQSRLGAASGAARFADYIHLVENTFHSAHNYQMLIAYQEALHLREDYYGPFPKWIREIIS